MAENVVIVQFDGGMVNDPRDTRSNVCRICRHFDAYTNKHKLTPYRDAATGDSSASTHQIANFLYANGIIYGLGTIDGTGFGAPAAEPALFKMTDLTTATWSADSHSTNPTGAIPTNTNRATVDLPAFAYYPTTGKIYGVRDLRYVYTVTPGSTYASSDADLTSYARVSNFLLHSKDDILYLGYDNKIAANNNGSWTVPALTLPANYVITQLAEYGNYLAIGCRPKNRGRSKVFLWDRDSTVTTLADSIDWGEGEIYLLEELEGYLVGCSFQFVTPGATSLDDQMAITTRTIFRAYSGAGGAIKFAEFTGASTNPAVTYSQALSRQKVNNRILFAATIPIVTTGYQGIWSIGRDSVTGTFSVTCDRLLDNGTQVSSIYGFLLAGDYMLSSFDISGTFGVDKTNSSATYTATSLYETTVNPNMPPIDRIKKKQLVSVGAAYESLPSGAQVIVKYRVDGGAWHTIFTETTTNTTRTESYTRASDGHFQSGFDYEFHIESTGGAEITGLVYKYDILEGNI